MSPLALLCAFAVGSALLAAWLDVNLESRRPEGILGGLVHCVLASVALQGVVEIFGLVAASASAQAQLAALLGLVLPGLVYGFLSGIWLVRVLRARMPA
jgi:hypothetical protein